MHIYNTEVKAIKMKKLLVILFGVTLFTLHGCEYFENSETLDSSTIEINITNLPVIPDSMTFAAWVEHDTDLDPTLIMASDAQNGNLYHRSEQPLRLLQLTQTFWLSIEHESVSDDSVFSPGSDRILSGRFTQGNCNLSVAEAVNNFNNVTIEYNLLTPTDGPGTNETSGIWFVEIDTSGLFNPLSDLPALFPGWIYEGWVEVNGTYLSTGRFSSPAGADMRNAYGGSQSGIPFPGEDFLENAPAGITFPLDLTGKKVYISLELNDGRTAGDSPYITIFESTVPDPAESMVAYQLAATNEVFPSGDVVIKIDLVK